MAITISGENNNDRILASDGVIDQISGINFSGIITASHIDVGSNIQLGNAGIITATTFVGNVTGNVNNTSPLLLQTGGSERFRITGNNELGIAGANYGSSGQVLTSGGSGSAVTWSTPTVTSIVNYADNKLVTATGNANTLNAEGNLTFDGTTLQVQNSGSGLRELLRLKNSNASAGVSGLYFNSTTSGTAFDAACVRNGVNGSGQGRLFLQTNNGSGLVTNLSIEYDGQVSIPTNSLNINDSIVHIDDTDTKIRFPAANTFAVETAGYERLRIDNQGSVMIATGSVTSFGGGNTKLQVRGASSGLSDGAQIFDIASTAAANGGTRLAFGVNEDTFTWIRSYESAVGGRDMVFAASDEKMRVKSTGQIRIGNENNLALWGQNNRLQVAGTDWNTSGVSIACMGTSGSANLILGSSRASTPGGSGSALVQDSRLGYISFVGDDGTDMHTIGAAIVAELDSNASSNSMPGRLRFYTGGNSNERLRISADGKINIGTLYNASTTYLDIRFDDTTAYSNTSNHVNGIKIFNDCTTDNGFAGIELAATDGDDYYGSTLLKSVADGTNYSNDFVIQTRHNGNYGERLRIQSDGNIGIGEWGTSNIPQGLSLLQRNLYLNQGKYITWNNGDCEIEGISGFHLKFSTYNGSSMTEVMQLKSDSSLYLPNGLTNRYGMYEVATGGTLNPSSATTWTWDFYTQSGTGSTFKIEAYFNHWNTNSNYWSYQEHVVMHRDNHTNYAGFDIRRHAGGLGSWATEIVSGSGTYNEKIRVKWNVGSGSAYMGGYYIRISTCNPIDPESLVVA